MSWGYPDGCDQNTHDRAFGELGPSPAELAAEADAQNDQEWQDHLDQEWLADKVNKTCWHCCGSGDMVAPDEEVLNELRGIELQIRYVPCPECAGRGRLDK